MVYANIPLCFRTKEYNPKSPICKKCGLFKDCKKPRFKGDLDEGRENIIN